MDVEKILSNLVRVGIVTAVNNDKHLARVTFEDTKLPSGAVHLVMQPQMLFRQCFRFGCIGYFCRDFQLLVCFCIIVKRPLTRFINGPAI